MGLDMYLYKRVEPHIDSWGDKTDLFQVGYWRKANQVHAFFVDECADGVDECQETEVPTPKLIELRERCRRIIEDPMVARELLPPRQGFFFGNYELDDWYFADIKETITILTDVLADANEATEFVYQASW